jgi:hypothetical protein
MRTGLPDKTVQPFFRKPPYMTAHPSIHISK